ncbi:hypothetical protein NUW54_g9607 [Trametes sanguinea]|uniref:Uncharacterized protein n=1 Tax=Trametes sanguinea TaxID=158606 RepID=A0ACC1P7M1_9APHY|nr:hypothetical protein NUW54_g9607 [Trametes sanguinea]
MNGPFYVDFVKSLTERRPEVASSIPSTDRVKGDEGAEHSTDNTRDEGHDDSPNTEERRVTVSKPGLLRHSRHPGDDRHTEHHAGRAAEQAQVAPGGHGHAQRGWRGW